MTDAATDPAHHPGAAQRPPEGAAARLRQLDREWDQEQVLLFSAAALGFVGALLSLTVDRAFILLPALAVATLAQYLLQGWCPPLPLLARLGLRSSSEIDRERYAIAARLGDAQEPQAPALAAGAD